VPNLNQLEGQATAQDVSCPHDKLPERARPSPLLLSANAKRGWAVVEIEFAGAWAEITHHRYVLRRMAQQRVLELPRLAHAARRLHALGARVGSNDLVGVSSAILAWSEQAMQSEAREQAGALLLELSGALDHLCATQNGAVGYRHHLEGVAH